MDEETYNALHSAHHEHAVWYFDVLELNDEHAGLKARIKMQEILTKHGLLVTKIEDATA